MRHLIDAQEKQLSETTYTIQMASKLSGVGVHTIRAWEKRYKALIPARDVSGHRTYSKTDVEKLMLLSELCLLGYTISKVANLSISELKALLVDLGKSEDSLNQSDFNLVGETKQAVDPSQVFPLLSFALKSGKLDIVALELDKLKWSVSPRDLALNLIYPLTKIVSESLNQNNFSQTQHESALSLLKFYTGFGMYQPLEKKERSSIHILVAGFEGDSQEINLKLVCLLCAHYGFHFTYVGADRSADFISDMAKSLSSNVVFIGPTQSYTQQGKSQFQSNCEKLSQKLASDCELVISGKCEVDTQHLATKRSVILKSFEAIDDYLSKKIN